MKFYTLNKEKIMIYINKLYKVFVRINRVTRMCGWNQGREIRFQPDSEILYLGNFLNNKRHGSHRAWQKNGTLQCDVNYLNGERHGLARYLDNDNQTIYIRNYHNGKLIEM